VKKNFYKLGGVENSNKKRRVLYIVIAAALVAIYYLVFDGESGYLKIRAMERKILERKVENTQLAEANDRLREEIDRLRNDPAYIEKIAREKLGLAKKGEIIYRFIFEPK